MALKNRNHLSIQNEDFSSAEMDDMQLKEGEEYYGPCLWCGKKAYLLCLCKVWYCSKACQMAHWSEHWMNCELILRVADEMTVPLNWRQINKHHKGKPPQQENVVIQNPSNVSLNKTSKAPFGENKILKMNFFDPKVGEKVYIRAYEYGSQFSAVFVKDLENLEMINELIKDFMKQPDETEVDYKFNDLYLAKNNVNGSWSRVALISLNSNSAELYFLDYGIIDTISKNLIRNLSKRIQNIEILCKAFRFDFCLLPGNNEASIFEVVKEQLPVGIPFEVLIVDKDKNKDDYHIKIPKLTETLKERGLVN